MPDVMCRVPGLAIEAIRAVTVTGPTAAVSTTRHGDDSVEIDEKL